ncbi:hypothetical protein R3O65_04985 [Corynebacterium pseudodiphtheriticum]|nr:hypothetical protein [Corynebacterium pseudodiphtheriticum]MDK4277662.1 hypothetical protein [Corynebacterium pseudodiphtheriticum]
MMVSFQMGPEIPEGITVRAETTRRDIEKKIMLRNSSIAHE